MNVMGNMQGSEHASIPRASRDWHASSRNVPHIHIVVGAQSSSREPAHAADAFDVQTLPQPIAKSDNLSVASLHIKSNILDITYTGETRTQFINRQGPAIRWKAQFVGTEEMLQVNDRWEHAEHGSLPGGTPISWIIVTVPPAGSVTVSREKQ